MSSHHNNSLYFSFRVLCDLFIDSLPKEEKAAESEQEEETEAKKEKEKYVSFIFYQMNDFAD